MGITLLGTVTQAEVAGANYVVDLTSLGLQEGDLVLVVTGWTDTVDGNPGVTTSGYTEILDLRSNDARDANLSVNWKIMGSSPDTSVTCIANAITNRANGAVIYAFRGVDITTPIDVTSTSQTYTNGANPTAPAITPATAGAVIVIGGCLTSITTMTPSAPSGYSNLSYIYADDTGVDFTIALATKEWAGGTETPGAWGGTFTGTTSDGGIGFTVALRPGVQNQGNFLAFF